MEEFDLKRLQQIELAALKEVIRICEKNNIKWFLIGGSALGAVRHGGFIPWDDDIDIGMMREDYERFLKAAERELSKKYFLQTLETDKEYHLGYAKIRVNDTLYIQENVADRNMHHGIFVDVYPIDSVPDGKFARKRQKFYADAAYILCRGKPALNQGVALWLATSVITACMPKSALKRIGMWLYKKAAGFKGKEIANIFGIKPYYDEIMPKEYMGEPILMDFEDIKAYVPKLYDKYLTHLYGDYKTPVGEDSIKHMPVKFKF